MIRLFRFAFRTYYRSNYLSYRLRRIIEKINIRVAVGLHLASTMFVAAVFVPQLTVFSSVITTNNLTEQTPIDQATQTEITFRWPLNSFQISQYYKFYHPGLDLTAGYDDPVLAAAQGLVEAVIISKWGYGKYIIIRHDNGYTTLYAHLSSALIKVGDKVNQGDKIGTVGVSGWSTGIHLHFEIYGPEGSLNPLEILPAL